MDIGKSFTYMFEDPNWVAKLAIGGAILLVGTLFSFLLAIPLIAAAAIVLGYSLVVTRNVAEGVPTPLPEWNNFGELLVKGLTAVVGAIIWFIPIIILGCCLGIVNAVLAGAASNNGQGSSAAGGAIGLVSTCLGCLIAIVALVESLTFYAPLTRYALNGQLNTFWDFAGNWSFIQANMGNYVVAFLLGPIVASFIAGFGVIACVIGVFFTQFWAYLVTAHLFGQVARGMTATQSMPPMAPMAPPPMAPTMPA